MRFLSRLIGFCNAREECLKTRHEHLERFDYVLVEYDEYIAVRVPYCGLSPLLEWSLGSGRKLGVFPECYDLEWYKVEGVFDVAFVEGSRVWDCLSGYFVRDVGRVVSCTDVLSMIRKVLRLIPSRCVAQFGYDMVEVLHNYPDSRFDYFKARLVLENLLSVAEYYRKQLGSNSSEWLEVELLMSSIRQYVTPVAMSSSSIGSDDILVMGEIR